MCCFNVFMICPGEEASSLKEASGPWESQSWFRYREGNEYLVLPIGWCLPCLKESEFLKNLHSVLVCDFVNFINLILIFSLFFIHF